MQRRPGRTLLTLLGIALGLATVVASRLAMQTVTRAYHQLFESVTDDSLEITASGLAGFDPATLPDLTEVAGVKQAVPRIRGAVAVLGPSGGVTTALLGLDVPEVENLKEGRQLSQDDEALLDAGLADMLGVSPGGSLRLWTAAGLVRLALVGRLEPRGATAGTGGLLVVPLATARRLLGLAPAQINCLRLELEDGADLRNVKARLVRQLPPTLLLRAPGVQGELAHATVRAADQGLTSLGVLALLTAGFVIYNTFLLDLGERRRQIALLRTLGATRLQVLRLLLVEALLLGLAGTALGCAAGAALAVGLVGVLARFLGVGLPGLHLTPAPFLLAAVVGPLTPLLAVMLPAWQASRRSLLGELLAPSGDSAEAGPGLLAYAGWVLLGVGLVLAVGLCRGWIADGAARAWMPVTLGLLLGGAVLGFPLLLGRLLRLIGARRWGLTGTLAIQQLARQRARTGLTASVLFLSLTVTVGFGHSLRGILRDLRAWYRQTIVAEFLVRGSMPDTGFALASALPGALADELRRLPGVAGVDLLAFLPGRCPAGPVLVLAKSFPESGPLPLDLREGETEAVRAGLLGGEVVLGTGLAGQLRLHRGDSFTLATVQGPISLRVAGIAAEFAAGGTALYLEWETARRLFHVPGAHVFLVHACPGTAASVRQSLHQYCARHHLLLQSNAELRTFIDRLVVRLTSAIWVVMGLVCFVSALGVVNSLQMNIHDQTRTFGLLCALGLRRRQVCRVVLAQGLILSGCVLLPALLAGVGLAYLISRGSACWAGSAIQFRLDGTVLIAAAAVALAASVLAFLPLARRLARFPVIEALSR
jgi:putative ABC transport system permease protein